MSDFSRIINKVPSTDIIYPLTFQMGGGGHSNRIYVNKQTKKNTPFLYNVFTPEQYSCSKYHDFIATFSKKTIQKSSMMIMIKCKYLIIEKYPVTSQSLSNLMSGKASPQKQLEVLHYREMQH